MNERYVEFTQNDFIKMWRTLKAESGYRETKCMTGETQTLEKLMDAHEERVLNGIAEQDEKK